MKPVVSRFQRNSLVIASLCLTFALVCRANAADDKKEAKEPSEAHKAAVAKITEKGGAVRRIAQNTDENEVSLHLAPPPIDDSILSSVAAVENVVWLELQGTKITDDGLKEVGKMKKLRRIHLERTGITDKGLKHLAGLNDLEYLNLYGTMVTDKGLDHLKGLKKLRKLYLWQTKVSDEAMAKLGKAMPELAVVGAAKPLVEPPKEIVAGTDAKEPTKPEKLLAEGKSVRITLTSKNFLSLAEVEVYPVGKKEKLAGEASQSSTVSGGDAQRAIDGNRDGVYSNNSVTHTSAGEKEFWMLKMPKKEKIGAIYIWNRSDCCGDRLSGAVVEILGDDDKPVWSGKIDKGANGGTYSFVGK